MPEAMSAVDVLVHDSSRDIAMKVPQPEDKKFSVNKDKESTQETDSVATSGEKCKDSKQRIIYSKEELLELRSAPASLQRPECFTMDFFRDGVWDIEAWHKSSPSRCASAADPDSSSSFDTGRKMDLLDNAIELAPKRRSFYQGCFVPSAAESDSKEKSGPLRRLGGRVGLGGDSKVGLSEGKERLTARASLRRRTMEKAVTKDNKSESELKPRSNHDGRSSDNLNREQRSWNDDRREGRSRSFKETNGESKENWKSGRDFSDVRAGDWNSGKMPEWMTDGPSSQTDVIELKGFDKEIEDERNAMRRESKGGKAAEKARKTSKGSSRSSTPSQATEKKQKPSKAASGNEAKTKGVDGNDPRQFFTPTDKRRSEDDAYLDLMDYLPPHLFTDDYGGDPGTQSKFSQWFQGHEGPGSSNSRPNSIPLGLESRLLQGSKSASPLVPLHPYFTPIQPAPPTHPFENPIAVSPLMDLFPKRQESRTESVNEVKGRMTLKDIEPDLPKPIGQKPIGQKPIGQKPSKTAGPQEKIKPDLTAFDKLVSSMKAAGQLPEKPAPVVSGLPEHLLPKPPKRTSPSFEKLKRALSRSPSPLGSMSPLYFAERQMSPLLATAGERLQSPDFFRHPVKQRAVSPGKFFSEYQENMAASREGGRPHRWAQEDQRRHAHEQRTPSFTNGLQTPGSFRSPKHTGSPIVPAAFLPTSVIKKMHSEKSETGERSDLFGSDLASKFEFANQGLRQFERRPDGSSLTESSRQNDGESFSKSDRPVENGQMLGRISRESAQPFDKPLFSKHSSSSTEAIPPMNNFAQREPIGRSSQPVGRSTQPTNQLESDFSSLYVSPAGGTRDPIGSGSLFAKNREDSEGAKRNSFDLKKEKKNEHAQSPATANRLQMTQRESTAQVNGSENRSNYMDNGSKVIGPALPSKTPGYQSMAPHGAQNHGPNQGSLPRGPASQKPLQPPFSNVHSFQRNRNPSQTNPRIPMAMNPPANNLPFNRPTNPAVTAAMAAQLVQQQLLQQAARAQVLQAAQAIQQQHQQQNLLRMQMQAAMVQAYVRGQNNLRAVAQQFGLLAPPGAQASKPLPTPLVTQQQHHQQQQQQHHQQQPQPQEASDSGRGNSENKPGAQQESPLSKWFDVDAIKKSPSVSTQDQASKANFISVEDLERSHNKTP